MDHNIFSLQCDYSGRISDEDKWNELISSYGACEEQTTIGISQPWFH